MSDPAPKYPFDWELSRPPTRFERLGFAASRWFGRLGAGLVVLLLLFGLVVGIPAWRVAGSDSYATARQFVVDADLGIGQVIGIDKVPVAYKVGTDKAEYQFDVRGEIAAGQASVTVARQNGVWDVTSASFGVYEARRAGVWRRRILRPGK